MGIERGLGRGEALGELDEKPGEDWGRGLGRAREKPGESWMRGWGRV